MLFLTANQQCQSNEGIDRCCLKSTASTCNVDVGCLCCGQENGKAQLYVIQLSKDGSITTSSPVDLWSDVDCIFTARCYASAVLAMGLCLSVCVCLPQVGVLPKWLNRRSHKQHHTIAQGLKFSDAKDLREIRPGSPTWGGSKSATFD